MATTVAPLPTIQGIVTNFSWLLLAINYYFDSHKKHIYIYTYHIVIGKHAANNKTTIINRCPMMVDHASSWSQPRWQLLGSQPPAFHETSYNYPTRGWVNANHTKRNEHPNQDSFVHFRGVYYSGAHKLTPETPPSWM